MARSVYIVSDLHLGGPTGFQITPPAAQRRLAAFVRRVAARPGSHLVLAGDVVDFLSESGDAPFVGDEAAAARHLTTLIDRNREVFDAFALAARDCDRFTVLLGNHDLELCLPAVRRVFVEALGGGPIEFLYDNEALRVGPLLVEHGNRYDAWNVVDHDALRRLRSTLSRGEAPAEFDPPVGSRLVVEVMNPIKARYPFVDVLKPENEAVLPLLGVLWPVSVAAIWRLNRLRKAKNRHRYDTDTGAPLDLQNIAAGEDAQLEALALTQALAGGDASGDIGVREVLAGVAQAWSDLPLDALRQALRHLSAAQARTFDPAVEGEPYLTAARSLLAGDAEVVVFGHTHLAKHVTLPGGVYLNSGTWADLMRVPEDVFARDPARADAALRDFVRRCDEDRLDGLRGSVPTFARVDLSDAGDRVLDCGVFVFPDTGDDADESEPERATRDNTRPR
jgi:UDP-2,3-diacylglucosamine pyrophosphatase LpxH